MSLLTERDALLQSADCHYYSSRQTPFDACTSATSVTSSDVSHFWLHIRLFRSFVLCCYCCCLYFVGSFFVCYISELISLMYSLPFAALVMWSVLAMFQ